MQGGDRAEAASAATAARCAMGSLRGGGLGFRVHRSCIGFGSPEASVWATETINAWARLAWARRVMSCLHSNSQFATAYDDDYFYHDGAVPVVTIFIRLMLTGSVALSALRRL